MPGPFELALREFAAKAGERADQVVREVVLEVGARLVARSPVDTGRFRSNWFQSEGGPLGTMTERTGVTTVNGVELASSKMAGKTYYIQNNLPYAWRLENGWSQQAPAGMVGLTVIEFAGIVDGAAKKVNP